MVQALEELFPLYVRHVLGARRHEYENSPFRNTLLIHAGGPASIYWSHEPDAWDLNRDLGVISPLAKSMWIEAKPVIPMSRLRQDLTPRAASLIEAQRKAQRVTPITDEDAGRKVAIHIQSVRPRDQQPPSFWPQDDIDNWNRFYHPDAHWHYEIEVYVETDRGFSSSIDSRITLLVDQQGRHINLGFQRFNRVPQEIDIDGSRSDNIAAPVDLTPFLYDATIFALYSLSLANAKNIGMIDESAQIHSKDIKKIIKSSDGVPATFSRINLNAVSTPSESSNGSGGASRLHFVRGHFKTYTEDAKLMGKHVGTYYWSHHARGDQSEGAVDQIYEV